MLNIHLLSGDKKKTYSYPEPTGGSGQKAAARRSSTGKTIHEQLGVL
jgi:hypothetical protein